MKVHKDLIMELPGFVPEVLCNDIIQKFESDDRKIDGRIKCGMGNAVETDTKNTKELHISHLEDWKLLDGSLHKYIQSAVGLYLKYFKEEYDFVQPIHTFGPLLKSLETFGVHDNGYSIQKQIKGYEYKWHYDMTESSFLFGMVYLNTIEPDEGGCTEFLSGRKIRPEIGKIMLSPASWTCAHRGNKFTSENKYIISFMIFCGEPK